MKKLALVALLVFAFQTPAAMAWVGGPWSNDSYSPGAEQGTYQASGTFSNGMGIMRWSIDNNADVSGGQDNTSVWWYRGATYVGNTFGIVDIPARFVSGINSASSEDTDAINDSGTTVERLTASWTAHIYTRAPQLRFTGTGTVQFFGDLDDVDTEYNIQWTYTDEVITGPGGDVIITISRDAKEEWTGTGGEESRFPSLGTSATLRVFGSRTSWFSPNSTAQRTNGLIQLPN